MSLLSLLAICLLWLACAGPAFAGDASPAAPPRAIWSGLIFATNDAHPSEAPSKLRKFADKLKNIFGYNQFELIGEAAEKMDDPYERWLIPSKDFCLSVKSHTEPGQHYPMKIALFQNRHRLAEFETRLNSESPLFIRGPLYARGQLVIVLHLVDASEVPVRAARTPLVAANPSPVSKSTPFREKPSLTPASLVTVPKERFNPAPDDRFGPMPGPFRQDPEPFEGARPGDIGGGDSKFTKP